MDDDCDTYDVMPKCHNYPVDEAPDTYKDLAEVLRGGEGSGFVIQVTKLQAR